MTLKLSDPPGAKRDSTLGMLNELCPEANLEVAADGTVTTQLPFENFCKAVLQGFGPPIQHRQGCACICAAIASGKTATIEVAEDLTDTGGGRSDMHVNNASNGIGSDVRVLVEDQNRWVVQDPAGNWVDHPDWTQLGHELCGHAVPGLAGTHPQCLPDREDYDKDWHVPTYEREDAVRAEHGLPALGIHAVRKKP